MKWHRRIYLLNGSRIDTKRVAGMLHTAKNDLRPCMGCLKMVEKGQKYVMLSVIGADPLHFRYGCMAFEEEIVGVRTTTISGYGIPRNAVVCKRFKWNVNNHSYEEVN